MRFLLAVLFAVSLAAQTPSSDVAVSVWPFLEGNMDGRVNEIVTNCTTRGIDTVYVSTFRATGPSTGNLWITDSAGDWNPAWGTVRTGGTGINLVSLISACHAANIRVVAILKCFADTVQPTDAAHRQYLLSVIDYLVDAYQPDGRPVYDLDGIALDYIRFVGTSGTVDPTVVTNFLADVRARVRGLSLQAYLIASRYTFDGGTYNGNFQSYATVINSFASQYGQHWEQMARHCDVLMPMSYTANGSIYNTYALHQAYVRQTAAYARTACQLAGFPSRRVCPAIRTYSDTAETTTDLTIEASITGALLGGADGYHSFRYEHLVSNPTWWTKMQQYAVPGCNWPLPQLAMTSPRLSTTADPGASRDNEQLAATLQVRFDHDDDGAFDTPWLPNGAATFVSRYPGTWRTLVQVRDAQNHVAVTRRRYTAGSAVTLSQPWLNAGTGGQTQIQLDVGPAGAGATYLVLGTLSGTAPGFAWRPGFPVPINVDFVTQAFAADPNGVFLNHGLGLFDVQGRATATLTVPPGLLQPLVWNSLHWSFLSADLLGRPVCVGDARALQILP